MDHREQEDRVKWRLWEEWWLLKDHKEPLGDGAIKDYSKPILIYWVILREALALSMKWFQSECESSDI